MAGALRRLATAGAIRVALTLLLAVATGCGGDASRTGADGDSATASAVSTVVPGDSLMPIPKQPGMTSTLPRSPADALGAFRLAGNEPFWSVRIAAEGLTYTTPDYQPGIRFPGVAPEQHGTALRWVTITSPPEAHTIDVTLEEESCHDSMSDKTWTHTARVIFDGSTLEGCGERVSKR
ncbi:MAG: hypothetical protein ABI910_07165 [Gemmatimonadota bacterium]